MARITLEEAELQLATVQAALQDFVSGKRLTRLEVGSGNFRRIYQYSEISYENLIAMRNELQGIVDMLTPAEPSFRTNCSIPLVVKKDRF